MDQNAYEQYLIDKNLGKKAEAKVALEAFLNSFGPGDDRRAWVIAYLEGSGYGHRIRHEIYERLIFPVLLQGYEQGEPWSIRWLAKTSENLQSNSEMFAKIGYKGKRTLLIEAYEAEPTEEVRQLLLDADLKWFAYSQHEWPTGILSGAAYASIAECDEILRYVAFARRLDAGEQQDFLNAFEQKVHEYKSWLEEDA